MTKLDFYWKFIERPKRIMSTYLDRLMGWDTPDHVQRAVDKHRNEIVLDTPDEVVLLLGWTDQFVDDDYYWIVYSRRYGLRLHSCVGGYVWLKDRLTGFEYHQAEHVFHLNVPDMDTILKLVKDGGYILK